MNKDPTFKTQGNGKYKILERNDRLIRLEITAYQGNYTVFMTTKERWNHIFYKDLYFKDSIHDFIGMNYKKLIRNLKNR